MPFLPEKVEKLVANLHDKTECGIHIINLKEALSHRLILTNVHRVIKFNQKKNTKLIQKAKNSFEKYFSRLMNNTVFGKTMENVRKQRY